MIKDDAEWLSVTPDSGDSTGEEDVVTIQYATATLRPGTHHATITVSDPEAWNSSQIVHVTVTIAAVSADFNADGDVDLADFNLFVACFNGPNNPPAEGCPLGADFDDDGDVSLSDFSVFTRCFNGPNRPPACVRQ